MARKKKTAQKKTSCKGGPVTAQVVINANPELKRLLCQEADLLNLPMSEMAVRIQATHYQRPDLSVVPRKRAGRPRKPLPGDGPN
jgi:hypothetical protein